MSQIYTLSATHLASYVRYQNCDRYLRFRLQPQEEKALRRRWDVTLQPLAPLLSESGKEFEAQVEAALARRGETLVRLEREEAPAATLAHFAAVVEPTLLLQAHLEAPLGACRVNGYADVVRLWRGPDGRLSAYIADIKSSRKEKMEHRLQIAVYAYLVRQMCAAAGIELAEVRGGVLHADADCRAPALDGAYPTFDLEPYFTTLRHLILDEDSIVNRVAAQPLAEVPYKLGFWCDDCLYNATCMYDSAERMDLSLVPGMTAVERRTLLETGVRNVRDLAALMDLPPRGSYALTPAPDHVETVQALSGTWPIGPNLPLRVQKAQGILRERFDGQAYAVPWMYGTGWSALPSEEALPGLVKIFFDAQFDYLRQRVYLASALVVGPGGRQAVVRHTPAPPTSATERELLVAWIGGILTAVTAVAEGLEAPLHLYCYNSYDQRMLLDALKRHLDEVALLPGFFDLMTQHPAVSQPVISFLSDELEAQKNLGLTCMPLHDAARRLGFDWRDGQYDYFTLFRARMFDNRRDIVRRYNGQIKPAPIGVPKSDPRRRSIESASRFGSQIPLEYAYAAWDQLPDLEEDRALLKPYASTTWAQLDGFARWRVEALAHIEASFRFKSKYLDKPPLNLSALQEGNAPQAALAQSLKEFLVMEHYAAFQARMQVYNLPIERRVQTGLALLLRFDRKDDLGGAYRFDVAFDQLGLEPVETMNNFRLKEGSWIVLNKAGTVSDSGTRVKNGRLGIIQAVDENLVELELLDITFGRGSRFRYYHQRDLEPEVGELYTLDEMADDMNGDKTYAALSHAEGSAMHAWLTARPEPRAVPDEMARAAQEALAVIEALVVPSTLTEAQRATIAGHLDEPLFLVQGPPGTGKSYTLGWTAVARLLVHARLERPLRIAVASRTHNAVNIVLNSIASKWQTLQAAGQAPTVGLLGLPLYKIVNDGEDEGPEGAQPLHVYSHQPGELDALLAQPYVIVGGTPGGLYSLAKRRGAGGSQVDWTARPFDLLIIDEASQMSLPEAVLAGAFLQPDGQAVVVGDHRQMPPIIAHDWENEELRSAAAAQPHLSLFESLLARGFPRVSLDESFRLHHTIAQFLQDNIYVHDGIQFHSKRTAVLPAVTLPDAYAQAVLDPDYPIVVIEHGERASQQYNATELALLEPLLRPCMELLGLNGSEGLGVVVPHRAQRAMLQAHFPQLAVSDAIDTVERFQGGERDVIVVSATASDPDFVLAEADFLLNLNRLNVALSRPRKKLIVMASRSVTNLLVSDLDVFENAVIWKRLYYEYAQRPLWTGAWQGVPVWVRGHGVD